MVRTVVVENAAQALRALLVGLLCAPIDDDGDEALIMCAVVVEALFHQGKMVDAARAWVEQVSAARVSLMVAAFPPVTAADQPIPYRLTEKAIAALEPPALEGCACRGIRARQSMPWEVGGHLPDCPTSSSLRVPVLVVKRGQA